MSNDEATKLWQSIYPTTHAPREILVAYIKTLCQEAANLPHEVHPAQAAKRSSR